MSADIIQDVSFFVNGLFDRALPKELTFHQKRHTEEVVEQVLFIGEQSIILEEQLQMLEIAAWFHDSGYCYTYINHEVKSIDIAVDFLKTRDCPADYIQKIEYLITATRLPQNPFSRVEEIICDADMAHLASDNYPAYSERLRKEWAIYLNKTYTDEEWDKLNIDFLTKHHYFSKYGQQVLEPLKQKQLRKIKSKWEQ
ncbi:hypothetical protein GCM10023149_04850 [Mucilaginibacter gynuensis]|uniref:HD domain-containing protein n=2 Tax=Mucilaginibacter gynuensis TaxID=1302236 RepID=A0ABP8FTE3_9SPHI